MTKKFPYLCVLLTPKIVSGRGKCLEKKDCSDPSCLNEKLHIRHSHGKNTGYLLSQGETGLSTIAKVLPKALLLSSSGLIHFGKVRLKLPLTFIQLLFLCVHSPFTNVPCHSWSWALVSQWDPKAHLERTDMNNREDLIPLFTWLIKTLIFFSVW